VGGRGALCGDEGQVRLSASIFLVVYYLVTWKQWEARMVSGGNSIVEKGDVTFFSPGSACEPFYEDKSQDFQSYEKAKAFTKDLKVRYRYDRTGQIRILRVEEETTEIK
jgi:hypothetical protein